MSQQFMVSLRCQLLDATGLPETSPMACQYYARTLRKNSGCVTENFNGRGLRWVGLAGALAEDWCSRRGLCRRDGIDFAGLVTVFLVSQCSRLPNTILSSRPSSNAENTKVRCMMTYQSSLSLLICWAFMNARSR